MPRRNQLALILIGLAVIASGCADTTGDEAVQTKGVEMLNFTSVPGSIYDTQQVSLNLRLQNQGGDRAENVRAKIFNQPFGDREKQEWEGTQQKDFNNLAPADKEAGIDAMIADRNFALTPPDLEKGLNIDYNFMVRVKYDYQTTGISEILLMTEERSRQTDTTRTKPAVDNTAGPIQLDINTRTPIIFYEGGSTSSNLCVVVENKGDGTPYLDSVSNSNKVEITLSSPGEIGFKALGTGEGNHATVDLIGDTGRQCFQLQNFDFSATEDIQRSIALTVKADYSYYVEDQTTVYVRGRGEGSSYTSGSSSDSDTEESNSQDSDTEDSDSDSPPSVDLG